MTTALRSSSGEKSSSPIAFTPARAARPSRTWRSNAPRGPPRAGAPSATSRPATSETGGVNGASSLLLRLRASAPSRSRSAASEPRRGERGLGDGGEAEAGRRHERLLRAGDDDVEAPRVGLARHGAEARDRVDDDERARLLRDRRERLHVGDDAGRGLGLDDPDRLRLALARAGARTSSGSGVSPQA